MLWRINGAVILARGSNIIPMEELEGSQKMEEQLDPSDTEHRHRRQVSEQPSLLVDPSSSSYTTTAKESDEETVMTTTTFKDTDWESTTFKETDEGDTTAKETEDEGDETETEDEETISMRKKMGAVFLTECSSSQVVKFVQYIIYGEMVTITLRHWVIMSGQHDAFWK